MKLRNIALKGSVKHIKVMLDDGFDIHTDNDAMLFWAVHYDNFKMVKFLLDMGANIHANNDRAFLEACVYGNTKTVKLLLYRSADIHASNNAALRTACSYGYMEIIRLLLQNGAHTIPQHKKYYKLVNQLLGDHRMMKKYWKKWRRFMVSRWARRILQVWFRPDMPGGRLAKKTLSQF